MKRTVTMGLRLWTLATRFVLVFFLARFLPAADVGLYGLLAATVSYVVYVLGMDMYTYTTREILKSDQTTWRSKIANHMRLLGSVYVFALPLFLLLFAFGLMPWTLIIWFYLIAVTEHIGLEVDRMLIAMSDQFKASIVIFVRQALLPTMMIPLFLLVPSSRQLDLILIGWVCFNVVAIVFGSAVISRKTSNTSPMGADWQWIRRGLKISLAFLVGTLCLRAIFTVDRQVIAVFEGFEVLGAYTFAMSVGTGLSSVLTIVVHQFSYPKLVVAANEKRWTEFRRELLRMTFQTLALTGLAALLTLVFGSMIISWVGTEIYAEYQWLLIVAILVMGLYNLAMVPHYALYALHADRAILLTTVISLVVYGAIVVLALVAGYSAVVAVIVGLVAASISLLGLKLVVYFRLSHVK